MLSRFWQLIAGPRLAPSSPAGAGASDMALPSATGGRVDDLARRFPGYVAPMMVLTGVYLLAAIGFLAWVVDYASAGQGAARGSVVIRIGWLLAAAAITLAAWDPLLRRLASGQRSLPNCLLALGATAAAALLLARVGAEILIEHPAQVAGGDLRRSAVQMNVLTRALGRGTVTIQGFDLPPDASTDATGKAVLALFPSFALPDSDRSQADIGTMLEAIVARDIGDAADSYNHMFIPSVRALRDAYNNYAAMQHGMVAAIGEIPTSSAAAWRKYLAGLALKKTAPRRLAKARWKENAAAVQQSGIAVADDWAPDDRRAFLAAAALGARQRIDATFAAQTAEQFGQPIPPSLTWQQFLAVPAVQARWRADLHAGTDVVLSPTLTLDQYKETVYQPWLWQITKQRFDRLLARSDSFAPGGAQEATGENTVRWMIAVPVLLGCAMLGVLFHGYRMLRYMLEIGIPGLRQRGLIAGAVVGGLILFALAVPQPASFRRAVAYIERGVITHFGMPTAIKVWGFVQLEPWLYPAGEELRSLIDGG